MTAAHLQHWEWRTESGNCVVTGLWPASAWGQSGLLSYSSGIWLASACSTSSCILSKVPFTLTIGPAMESSASFKYNFHNKTTGYWAMPSLYFNFIIMEERAYWQYFFFPNNNSLGAVNSKNLNGLQLLQPYVLFLSFSPSGPFGMKDTQETDTILSNLKAYGAEQDATEGSWSYNLIFIGN